jgi:hypothetical protein
VELEEERLTGLERPELPLPARLPEVDLVEVRLGAEVAVPVSVGDADQRFTGRAGCRAVVILERFVVRSVAVVCTESVYLRATCRRFLSSRCATRG